MSLLIQYMLKLSISLSVIYLFYQVFLRRLTFYSLNRWYLLVYSLLCFVIPFINVFDFVEQPLQETGITRYIPAIVQMEDTHIQVTAPETVNWKQVWVIVMAAGILFMVARLLVQYYSLIKIRSKAVLLHNDSVKLYHIDQPVIPFSFGNAIYVNQHQHSEEELKEIIRHEFIHVKQRHTLDIIWSECICIVNWYNPFAWLLRKAIRQNLEFIADQQVLQNGFDRKQYQYLLLKVTGGTGFSIATNFNFSSLKKRIAMMNKAKSAKVHLLRFLFMLPLLAVILLAFRNTKQQHERLQRQAVNDTIPGALIIPDDIHVKANKIIIHLKNGQQETFDLTVPKERQAFEKKYGTWAEPAEPPQPPRASQPPIPVYDTVPAPPPAPAPKSIQAPRNIRSIDVSKTNNTITITLQDGQVEKYNLSIPKEKEAYESKYGPVREVPKPQLPPAPPVARKLLVMPENIQSVDVNKASNTITITLKNGVVEKYNLSVPKEKEAFDEKYSPIRETPKAPLPPAPPSPASPASARIVATGVDVAFAAEPTADIAVSSDQLIVDVATPMTATLVAAELVSFEISKRTTAAELEQMRKNMRERGVEMTIKHTSYRNGLLTAVSVSLVPDHGSKAFYATDELTKGKILIVISKNKNGQTDIAFHGGRD